MLYAHTSFEVRKRNVLQTDIVQARTLGQHFVVGYSSFDEVVPLAGKGLIAGIYVARHNIAGRTAEALKSEIAALQDRRRIARYGGTAGQREAAEAGSRGRSKEWLA
jgi:beta-N-acetylhexosaminidase